MIKRIFTVCLVSGKPVTAQAAFTDGRLVITKLDGMTGLFSSWKKKLIEKLKEYQEKDYYVLIEEHGDEFSEFGLKLNLDSPDPSVRRAYMNIAFDHYYSQNALGNVIVPEKLQRHKIQSSLVNVLTDDKGRNQYDFNRESFNAFHRVQLLCAIAAFHIFQTNQDYINEFMACVGAEEDDGIDLSTVRAIQKRSVNV